MHARVVRNVHRIYLFFFFFFFTSIDSGENFAYNPFRDDSQANKGGIKIPCARAASNQFDKSAVSFVSCSAKDSPLLRLRCLTTKSLVVENSLRRLSHGCFRARAEAADRACTHDVRGSFAFSLGQRDTGELLFSATLPRIERSGIATPPPNTNLYIERKIRYPFSTILK